MLCGFYGPTDFDPMPIDPSVPVGQKLLAIERAVPTVEPWIVGDKTLDTTFNLTLPYTQGGVFHFGLASMPEVLYTDYVNIGDPELYGKGIGTRMLRAACRYAVERDARVCTFATGWARIGLVNTAIRAFGYENVAVMHGKRYGWGGDDCLENIFNDFPPNEGKKYLVGAIEARIDPPEAMMWESSTVVGLRTPDGLLL